MIAKFRFDHHAVWQLAFTFLGLICIGGFFTGRSLAADDDSLEVALASPAEFEFLDTPLKEVLAAISQSQHIPIFTDEKVINTAGVQLDDIHISYQTGISSLGSILEKMLQPFQLCGIIRHQVFFVTSLKAAEEDYFETRVYKLIRRVPVERRVRSIMWNLAPASWAAAGGKGEAAPVPPDLIVVYQSALRQRQLARMFSQSVVEVSAEEHENVTLGGPEKRLEEPASIDVDAVPLATAMKQLASQCGVNISVDEAALFSAGLPVDDLTVTLRVGNIHSLAAGLSLLLETVDPELQWVVTGDGIVVTTTETIEKNLVSSTYDTKGLVADGDVSLLIEAIQYTIAASSWEDVGGDGTIERGTDGQTLVISQSYPVHRQLRQLFDALRIGRRAVKANAEGPKVEPR